MTGGEKRRAGNSGKAAFKKRKYASESAIVMPGMSGILLSCTRGMANKTVAEAIDLFQRYAEDTGTDGNSVANEMNNVEVELQAELASLRNPTGQGKQFRRLDYGSDMMIFLQTIPGDEDPFQLITRLFKGLKDSGTGRSFRYLQRLTPVQRTCYANMNDIQSTVDELLQTHLPWILQNRVGTDEGQFTFQILYRHRNNDQLDRESLVKAVSAKLYGVFPNCKADLKQPDIVVLLEVCKSVCCCAVVSDFYRLQKFNLNAAFPKT